MMRNSCRTSLGLAAAAVLGFVLGCTPSNESEEQLSVTIIGLDGAAWRVIDPMLERGELPTMAQLIESGVRLDLQSRPPLVSPPVWTSVATGVRRERHGILYFNDERGGLASSFDRKVPAIWNLASDAGLRSAVIGWWVTYPAEPIEGVVISERALKIRDGDIRDMFGGQLGPPRDAQLTHPPEVLSLVQKLVGVIPENVPGPEHVKQIGAMRAEDGGIVRLLEALREHSEPFRLELLLLRGIDVLSHHLWRFYEPDAPIYSAAERPDELALEKWGGALEEHYRFVDTLLGRFIEEDDSNRVLLVLSDHGFEAGRQRYKKGVLSGTHKTSAALNGIMIAAGGPIRNTTALARASIFDIAPTVLYLLGIPVAEDLDGRILFDILDREWVDANPVRRISSYGHRAENTREGPAKSSPTDARLIEELRGLGYIE